MDSPPWPPVSSPGSVEEEKCSSADWVDKEVMMKKKGGSRSDNQLGKWDEDGRQLPDMFYQKYNLDSSKVYPEQSLKKNSAPLSRRHSLDNGSARTQYETTATDDSDELEAETSDSSERDYPRKLNGSRSSNCIPNGVGSKLRRPSLKQQPKSPETR